MSLLSDWLYPCSRPWGASGFWILTLCSACCLAGEPRPRFPVCPMQGLGEGLPLPCHLPEIPQPPVGLDLPPLGLDLPPHVAPVPTMHASESQHRVGTVQVVGEGVRGGNKVQEFTQAGLGGVSVSCAALCRGHGSGVTS